MTRLDYQRRNWLDSAHSPLGEPSTVLPSERLKGIAALRAEHPNAFACVGCNLPFLTTGEEERPRPIHLCPDCRTGEEADARRHGVAGDRLSDDDLVAALAGVRSVERRMARAEMELATAEADGKTGTARVKRQRLQRLERRRDTAAARGRR
jgi:hypothetical protein